MSTFTQDVLKNKSAEDHFIEHCKEYGLQIVRFTPYRCFQILWLIVAILSMSNIVRVYWKYVRCSKLHRNIQILLIFFLTTALVLNLLFSIFDIYQLILSFVAVHPCDVFLPETFYPCFNIIFGIILELYLLIQTAMTFERTIATIYVRSYEHKKVLPAVIIALSTVSIAVGTQLWLYHGKVITHPQVSVLNTPIEIYDRTNCVLIFNVVVCGLTTASMIILVIINKKRQMKAIGELSIRYQTEENIDFTKLIARVAFIQVFSYTSQSLGSLVVRLVDKSIAGAQAQPVMRTLKLAISGMPLYTLLMSVAIEYSIRTSTTHRQKRLQSAVNVRNPTRSYEDFFAKQWRK